MTEGTARRIRRRAHILWISLTSSFRSTEPSVRLRKTTLAQVTCEPVPARDASCVRGIESFVEIAVHLANRPDDDAALSRIAEAG
jgi:hypothetical protein